MRIIGVTHVSERSALRAKVHAAVAAVLAAWLATTSPAGLAQLTYPVKPIRLIVPFTPGGPTDQTARLLAQKITESWGQQVVIENRGGANGNIGMEVAVKSPPDGYTWVIATVGTIAVNPSLYMLPFDMLKDFAPVIHLTNSPAVLVVHPSLPVKSVKELIALARKRPGELTFGSSGSGGLGHISGEMFRQLAELDMVHVPYKSSAPALVDLLGGQISMLFENTISATPHVKAGRLRALAVSTATRTPVLPTVPTVAESGLPGYANNSWNGILVPAGTPRELVTRINGEMVRILREPDTRERLTNVGAEIVGSTPEEFGAMIKTEIDKLARVVKAAKIRID
ncbi:MAG: tripartite tricarboxylate transporter substrate binding protein [Proteobacteria bacterium]|nr:tripartite tricarboxylate transporter substrate binding protein [Burkholderiales bacterium]